MIVTFCRHTRISSSFRVLRIDWSISESICVRVWESVPESKPERTRIRVRESVGVWESVCVCKYISRCTYASVYQYLNVPIYTHIYVLSIQGLYQNDNSAMFVSGSICECVYVCACVWVSYVMRVCVYVPRYVCVCVTHLYTYIWSAC